MQREAAEFLIAMSFFVLVLYVSILCQMMWRQRLLLLAAVGANNKKKGLTTAELQRLGGAEDGAAVAGRECTVCLDDIEAGQPARVLPECLHAFHRSCADQWLSAHSTCPICRAKLVSPQLPPPPPPPPPVIPPPVPVHSGEIVAG